MSHQIDVAAQAVRVPLARRRVAEIAYGVLRAERARSTRISITFVSARSIAAMNARHLGHAGATDVIAFAFAPEQPGGTLIGDIYIAPEIAKANAAQHGNSSREEVARLVVHGILHVLGYDHPGGRGRLTSPMWRRQEALVARLTKGRPRRRLTTHTG